MTLLDEPKSKTLTIEQFLAHPDFKDYELIDGVLTGRRPMGALSDFIAMRLAALLGLFCQKTGAGHIFGSETVYRCFGSSRTGRKGDVSFIRMGRLRGEKIPEGVIEIPADLIVEVVSPTDLAYSVEAKAQLYLNNGFEELWVIFPNTRTIHVRRQGEPAEILNENNTLKGRGALDGFTCGVRELFPR
jgi:Uma2 family endonuclease